MVQWPVFPLRGSVTQSALAAIYLLRACAARKRNDRLGLKLAVLRIAVSRWICFFSVDTHGP